MPFLNNEDIINFHRVCMKYKLTPRELQIVLDLIQCITDTRDIARVNGISVKTVKTHLSNIYLKTNTHDRLELALKFVDEMFDIYKK